MKSEKKAPIAAAEISGRISIRMETGPHPQHAMNELPLAIQLCSSARVPMVIGAAEALGGA